MLLSGLAWLTSLGGSAGLAVALPAASLPTASLHPLLSNSAVVVSARPQVSRTGLVSGMGNLPLTVAGTARVTLPVATLLPNWLSAQSGVLDWAEPVARWLSASTSATGKEDESEISIVPAEMISKDHLVCSELDEATINETVIQEDGSPKRSSNTRSSSAPSNSAQKSAAAGPLTAANAEMHQYEDFSTWLRSCVLGKISDRAEAESLAVKIEQTLSAANWQGEAIEPTLVEGLPAAKVGDRTLFVVTEDISYDLEFNAEVIATKWVNKLRLVLGTSPLHLVESQMRMYGLKPTGDFLTGEASWYGPYFQGRLTATGEIFDKAMFTAAHKTLPFDTFLKVTNLITGSVLVIRINDRGPYVGDRALDLSQGAAQYLGSPEIGLIPFEAEFLEPENRLQASLPYRAMEPSQDPLITMWRP